MRELVGIVYEVGIAENSLRCCGITAILRQSPDVPNLVIAVIVSVLYYSVVYAW